MTERQTGRINAQLLTKNILQGGVCAKNWIQTYSGNNLVKGYSKKYSVDKLCAVKELRMIGVEIAEEYERQLINSIQTHRQQRLSFKKKREEELNGRSSFESDENLAMIIGYTSGGFPYGVTHEEMEEINNGQKLNNYAKRSSTDNLVP